MPDTPPVLLEADDRIATITLNRPQAMNALDPESVAALRDIWARVNDDPGIWVAILTGAGDSAFCSGSDLKKTIPQQPGAPGRDIADVFQPGGRGSLDDGIQVWKPIIAAVDGYCLGAGLTLLSVTDFRIASHTSVFGLPEVRRGIFPTLGATHRLYRQLPHAIAMELILYGDNLSAQQALQYGLINRVVDSNQVMPLAREAAQRFTAGAPLTQRAIKESVIRGHGLPLEDAIRLESMLAFATRQTEDAAEGPKAFAEKRDPVYKGR